MSGHNVHPQARTTPRIRAEIRASSLSERTLARVYNTTRSTIRRWKYSADTRERSHRPHRLSTTLSSAQEAVVVELRRTLYLPLDDLLVVVREFIHPELSRSALDRLLRRHGLSQLRDLMPQSESHDTAQPKTFKDYTPGFVHIDIKYLPQMPDERQRRYLFVAIDRASRWVYLERRASKSKRAACGFLRRMLERAPFHVHTLLSDNDLAFTDRFTQPQNRPSGTHDFDQLCAAQGIEHRLIPPRHPQTNGLVERFNGRIADVLATTRFDSAASLDQTLQRYTQLYNHHIPQRALQHRTPVQALKQWQHEQPKLFHKLVYDHASLDIYERNASGVWQIARLRGVPASR